MGRIEIISNMSVVCRSRTSNVHVKVFKISYTGASYSEVGRS